MTSSAVDIPLVVEHQEFYVPVESDETGFPFDRDFDRNRDTDQRFRSQLEDIANRIPEFADITNRFPFRERGARPADDPEFRRFADPFSRLEDFGFPFNREGHPEEYPAEFAQDPNYFPPHSYEEYYQPPPSGQQQEYYQQQPQESQEAASCSENVPEASSQVPEPQTDKVRQQGNLQQSNTVDLGQQQEPVNERNQRSMSAPPDNRPRYTSHINIPVNAAGEMPHNQEQPQPQPQPQQQSGKPVERVIPIHIEGRDEPVTPRHVPPSFSRPNTAYTRPPPETIFGQKPEFYNKYFDQRHPQQEQFMRQQFHQPQGQRAPPQPKQQQQAPPQQQQQQQAPPQQQQAPPQQQQAPPPKQATPPPQPQPKTPIDLIQAIQKDVNALMEQVEKFGGQPKDKQYLYLDEMLTRNLLKLDNIDTQRQDAIRTARKEAIKCIEKCIGVLEAKAAANVAPQSSAPAPAAEKMEEETTETPAEAKTEEKPADQPMETEATATEKPAESTPMETAEPNTETRAVLVTDEKPQEEAKPAEAEAAKNPEEVKPEPPKEEESAPPTEEKPAEEKPAEENPSTESAAAAQPEDEKAEKKEKKKIKKKVEKK